MSRTGDKGGESSPDLSDIWSYWTKAALLCISPPSHYSWDRLQLPVAFGRPIYLLQHLLEHDEMDRNGQRAPDPLEGTCVGGHLG